MKSVLLLALCCLAVCGCGPAPQAPSLTFYLQLIRGDDEDKPPTEEARPVGARLNQRFHAVCRWSRYWELKRDCVVMRPGQTVRRRLSPERELELQLSDSQSLTARLYVNGTLARCRKQPTEAAFLITGGNSGENQAWFVVVRRDAPLPPEPD